MYCLITDSYVIRYNVSSNFNLYVFIKALIINVLSLFFKSLIFSYFDYKTNNLSIYLKLFILKCKNINQEVSYDYNKIAKEAGVSIGTVDRIIHNRGRVAKATKEKVEKIIKDSGYKPNLIAQYLKTKRTFKIGVLLPKLDSESGYWNTQFEGILKAEKELSAFSVSTILKEFNRNINGDFTKVANEILTENLDCLIIAPVIPLETYDFINIIGNLPYAFIDSPLPSTSPITTVAQSPFKAGYCAGRIMNLLKPNAKTFVSILMHKNAHNLQERSRGFISYFSNSSNVKLYQKTWYDETSEEEYYNFIDSLFVELGEIDGLFIPNNSVYRLENYFKCRNIEKRCAIIGFDLLPDNVNCLLNDSIDEILSEQCETQGYKVVYEIYKNLFLKQDIESNVDINIEFYLKENLPIEFIN